MSNGREEPARSEAVPDAGTHEGRDGPEGAAEAARADRAGRADHAGRAEPLNVWAGRIAEAVAPAEISFAGLTARVYAEGGRGRRGLLRSAPPAPGGAGGELATLLPTLWHALALSYDLLAAALGSPVVSNVVSGTALLLALEERRASGARDAHAARADGAGGSGTAGSGAGGSGTGGSRTAESPGGTPAGAPAGPGQRADLADLAVLAGAVAQVSRCLQNRGTPRHRADIAAAEAVAALYEGRDAGAVAFLGLLAGHRPPGAPAPAPASTAVSAVRRVRRRLAVRRSARGFGPRHRASGE
ncbi:hypothetical protein [Streptomyces lushanensis]|uniref:hypothetical protein n=1 Tax=Streptomyces lushanensis TaxID=1434255 RepID=UPI000829B618|nr:hypothetical protein [Streptomyces lushanensis]